MDSNGDIWQYHMRRNMQKIIDGLYLGPYHSASKAMLKTLLDHGISHIICIRQNCESHVIKPNFPDEFQYLVIDMADSMNQNLLIPFYKCRSFIDKCLEAGGSCLVHSVHGVSRSAAIIIAYVMQSHYYSYKEALTYVTEKRYCVYPNECFRRQLMEYEPIYKAEKFALKGQCSYQCTRKFKRKHDEEDLIEPMDETS